MIALSRDAGSTSSLPSRRQESHLMTVPVRDARRRRVLRLDYADSVTEALELSANIPPERVPSELREPEAKSRVLEARCI
jgi:hypothetical protein